MPDTQPQFYIGVKDIAGFLKLHPKTVQRLLRTGKVPGKKDLIGRWVLVSTDYYKSLEAPHGTGQP